MLPNNIIVEIELVMDEPTSCFVFMGEFCHQRCSSSEALSDLNCSQDRTQDDYNFSATSGAFSPHLSLINYFDEALEERNCLELRSFARLGECSGEIIRLNLASSSPAVSA